MAACHEGMDNSKQGFSTIDFITYIIKKKFKGSQTIQVQSIVKSDKNTNVLYCSASQKTSIRRLVTKVLYNSMILNKTCNSDCGELSKKIGQRNGIDHNPLCTTCLLVGLTISIYCNGDRRY